MQITANASKLLCRTAQGIEIEAELLRLTRHSVSFEIKNPNCGLQLSEVLGEFKIFFHNHVVYSGRAAVSALINTGMSVVCEATLDDAKLDASALDPSGDGAQLDAAFKEFIQNWGRNYRILPEFKILIADMSSYLLELRLWLEHVELGYRSLPAIERAAREQEVMRALAPPIIGTLRTLFGKFEEGTRQFQADLEPAYQSFCRRQLHPLLLCSPFMNRIYTKPLGYAGDYEMVNMILRNLPEGDSLYARMLNAFILGEAPAEAHRSRVKFLTQKLLEETNRVFQKGRSAKIFNIGCGPAGELQQFLRDHPLSDRAHVTLLDSNDETLEYVNRTLEKLKRDYGRRMEIKLIKKSVYQLLKQPARMRANTPGEFDFIYCAGLFDYLNDGACQALMNIFYDQLAPGGLLVATNVDSYNPIRNIMGYIFEWHLVYRNGREFQALAPEQAPPEASVVTAEGTSSNIFIEVRKPANKA